ncbi:TetR/AcrR family transcriptional regulator [Janthinobacterium agaricidamnosum]|uniref:Bacterial regulatory s, tetR family protein n=1 Tax=Janthinobacterium agaricidamnosum NBRC 102515 = DSM 9628 TaxID=1349767 RepID=W0VBT0_9BURK|nr:TetR/AcrR family transcriptional regulator [Janthinobacterium agaricidamnosum]CDG85341.1 bacterial regulatory s, tetR family protein [Janthinobacterium agaricidamnosum NBRC 102515 = DSM 9628]
MAGIRQFDEEAALDKALALFWAQGFEETTMPQLAAATGVQRGSLYHAYQGKETLFLRVFEVYRERFLGGMRQALSAPRLPQALQDFFDFAIDSMTTGLPTRGCLSTKTALGGGDIDQPVRQALQAMLDGLENILTERLEQPEAGVSLTLAPRDAARMIVTFTRGLVVIERVYQDKARLQASAGMLVKLLLPTAE